MTDLSAMGRIVQRHDPDRFFTALFAPPARREALFVLYAVNHELARAREVVSNPMLALIRLQWWREVAEGARRRHEVAGPLGNALDEGRLLPADILGMIDGREAEADGIEDMASFEAYVRAAYGGIAVAAGRALGAGADAVPSLRKAGAAYGVAGVVRSIAALAHQGRCVLPADVLAAAGLSQADVIADPRQGRMSQVVQTVAELGRTLLPPPSRPVPRSLTPAYLTAVLARRDLARLPAVPPRGLADKAAVAMAALTSRA